MRILSTVFHPMKAQLHSGLGYKKTSDKVREHIGFLSSGYRAFQSFAL
jgi:hypothetical protein